MTASCCAPTACRGTVEDDIITDHLAASPIAESGAGTGRGGAAQRRRQVRQRHHHRRWSGKSATDEDTPGVSTDELGDEVFASTIQASLGSDAGPGDNVEDDDLDEAAIERSIREINEAIRRSANGTRKV